jgi:hypothetical protein
MAQRPWLGLALILVGCFPSGEGVSPPADRTVYFPVGLALDGGARHLFIANSDFDLQFNAGTLESWDLDALRARLPVACQTSADCAGGNVCDNGEPDNGIVADDHVLSFWCVAPGVAHPCPFSREMSAPERQLYPGRCASLNPLRTSDGFRAIHQDSVELGAFATDVIYRVRPSAATPDFSGRLFVPVRSDATLHWIDVDDDGNLHCGQTEPGADGACAPDHRRGNNPAAENTRGLALLPEPFGIDANDSGEWIMVTNQASFATGLFQNFWETGGGFDNGPSYQYTVAQLPAQPIGVVSVPRSDAAVATAEPDLPEFLIGFRGEAQIDLERVYPDSDSSPPRPYAKAPDYSPIFTNASGIDSRGLAIDSSQRKNAEAQCRTRYGVSDDCASGNVTCDMPAAYVTCAQMAAAVPLDVLVTNRAPASLLIATTRQVISEEGTYDLPAFSGVVPLGFGPARVVTGDITTAAGGRERRAFAVSFDSRHIVVYDPIRQRVEATIVTGRGPQAMVIDAENALGYVAHFTDSYIGVIDLNQGHPLTYGLMIGMIETPAAPRASK